MAETASPINLEYRHEVLSRFFQYVETADSFYVIGAASTGKTRLLDFLMLPEVQKHYLGPGADSHWLIRVDLNRMPVKDPSWAFYELLISSILLVLPSHESLDNLNVELTRLDSEIIQHRDPLRALRFFELVVLKLCQTYGKKLCFLLDEFDEAYLTLPREIFLQLRGIRDANKTRICYGLFLRNLPERLRNPREIESFYELLSRNPIGIGPYRRFDAIEMIQLLGERKKHSVTPEQKEKIFQASGGHPGLILALLTVLIEKPYSFQKIDLQDWAKLLIQEEEVREECRKIWDGLSEEEQKYLKALQAGGHETPPSPVEKLLLLKGLLQSSGSDFQFFSGLFEQYVRDC